jgi:uncharacterized membrane protein
MTLALVMLYFERRGRFDFLREHLSILFIDNPETARVIIATLIGGIFSLTVFSFSMVMVLLNQASTNYSPRLLPGLISDKRNQGVLGIYIGSLIYNILVLISILPTDNEFSASGLSVFIGIVMGIFCLGMFVFFIHTISTSIQVNNILRKAFEKARKNIQELIEEKDGEWVNDLDEKVSWKSIGASESGFYKNIDIYNVLNFLEKSKISLKIAAHKGLFIMQSMTMVYIEKDCGALVEKDIKKKILLDRSIDMYMNYLLGIRYIAEVGIKAMSPGINDPATAISTLDYLAELFRIRLKIRDYKKYYTRDKNHFLIIPEVPFNNLLHDTLSAYRTYCKHDFNLVQKLQSFLLYLEKECTDNYHYKECISNQLEILQNTYSSTITNKTDLEILQKQLG